MSDSSNSPSTNHLSDSRVMQFLIEADSSALHAMDDVDASSGTDVCPRCKQAVHHNANVCRKCESYIDILPDFMRSMLQARPRV